MKDDKKRARLAELFGIEEHLPTEPEPSVTEKQETTSREAEAVIAYVHRPHEFKRVACKWCESVFAVNRANVAYCRDECRIKYLASIGIKWDPSKPQEERWDYVEPLTVPPQALVVADLAVEVLIQKEQKRISDENVESESQTIPTVYNL